jgi:hypothetical protein
MKIRMKKHLPSKNIILIDKIVLNDLLVTIFTELFLFKIVSNQIIIIDFSIEHNPLVKNYCSLGRLLR